MRDTTTAGHPVAVQCVRFGANQFFRNRDERLCIHLGRGMPDFADNVIQAGVTLGGGANFAVERNEQTNSKGSGGTRGRFCAQFARIFGPDCEIRESVRIAFARDRAAARQELQAVILGQPLVDPVVIVSRPEFERHVHDLMK